MPIPPYSSGTVHLDRSQPDQAPVPGSDPHDATPSSRKHAQMNEASGRTSGKRARPAQFPPAVRTGANSPTTVLPRQQPAQLAAPVPEIKQEAACLAQATAEHHARLAQITPQHMEAVAHALRGNSDALANCVTLAQGMLDFFKTGRLPEPASETPNTFDDFVVMNTMRLHPAILKQEARLLPGPIDAATSGMHVSQSEIIHGGHFDDHVLPGVFYSNSRNGVEELLESPGLDLTTYQQVPMQHDEAANILHALAVQCSLADPVRAAPATYGVVNLSRADNFTGHQLVYFARPDGVWFIDCQSICGGHGNAVVTDLKDTPSAFSDDANRQDAFQTRVFITPAYPFDAPVLLKDVLSMLPELQGLPPLPTAPDLDAPALHAAPADHLAPIPADAAAHYACGKQLLRQGDYPGALQAYTQAAYLPGDSYCAHVGRSHALLLLERFDDALAACNDAEAALPAFDPLTEHDGARSDLFAARAQMFQKLGRDDDALAAAQAAVELDPNNWRAYSALGVIQSENMRNGEAIEAFKKAAASGAAGPFLHARLAKLLNHEHRFEEALKAAEMVISLNDDRTILEGHLSATYALIGLNQNVRALAQVNSALAVSSSHVVAHRTHGDASAASNDDQAALSAFNTAT